MRQNDGDDKWRPEKNWQYNVCHYLLSTENFICWESAADWIIHGKFHILKTPIFVDDSVW